MTSGPNSKLVTSYPKFWKSFFPEFYQPSPTVKHSCIPAMFSFFIFVLIILIFIYPACFFQSPYPRTFSIFDYGIVSECFSRFHYLYAPLNVFFLLSFHCCIESHLFCKFHFPPYLLTFTILESISSILVIFALSIPVCSSHILL